MSTPSQQHLLPGITLIFVLPLVQGVPVSAKTVLLNSFTQAFTQSLAQVMFPFHTHGAFKLHRTSILKMCPAGQQRQHLELVPGPQP